MVLSAPDGQLGRYRACDIQLSQRLDSRFPRPEHTRLDLQTLGLELVLEVSHDVLRPRIIPNDGTTERFSSFATPGDGGLALVRDA